MPLFLAFSVDNPLLWAILIGWIISVVLHEFAHGLVAFAGGDYTIRDRGGLTLNPLQYIDPVFSIIIPAVILAIGGIPLPGGVTYIRRDLLRSRFWDAATSLAGPAMNLLLFIAAALPLHPRFGWINPDLEVTAWTTAQLFLATMAVLQLVAVVLNLAPVPPLDGFQAIAPFLPEELRLRLTSPAVSTFAFFAYFMILSGSGLFTWIMYWLFPKLMHLMGFGGHETFLIVRAYRISLFG